MDYFVMAKSVVHSSHTYYDANGSFDAIKCDAHNTERFGDEVHEEALYKSTSFTYLCFTRRQHCPPLQRHGAYRPMRQ